MFLLLSALYNFCTVFALIVYPLAQGHRNTSLKHLYWMSLISCIPLPGQYCLQTVQCTTNICYLLVNNKLQWTGSRLRSNFDLYNPVFQLHCFIIQRKSLFCTLPYFAFEHQWVEIEILIVLRTRKIEILSRVPLRNLVCYNFATFQNQMSQV